MTKTKSTGGKTISFLRRAGLFLGVSALGLTFALTGSRASNPTNGSVPASVGTMTMWSGTLNPIPANYAVNGEGDCNDAEQNCDVFALTVGAGDYSNKRVKIEFNWTSPTNDYDMVVRRESGQTAGFQPTEDAIVATSGEGATSGILTHEEVTIAPDDNGGIYYVRSVYYATPNSATDQYQGKASVFAVDAQPAETLEPSSCTVQTFDNYQPPASLRNRNNAGEPSIGINWNTGNIMAMARLVAYRASFDDSTSPANPTTGVNWFVKAAPNVVTGLDPILFTDPITGRTIGGELVALFGATQGGISDDDLNTFTNTFQTGGAVQGFDHQTIGGGPPNPNAPIVRQPRTSYPHLFYYASQQVAYGSVATSFDGGVTYDTAVTAYTLQQCNGLHGHIKVAPDGTVYLPNKNCGGKAAVVVSEDNGLTWNVRPIPSSSQGGDDPSVAIGAGGKVYVAYTSSDGKPRVAVSDDRGRTWHDDKNLSLGVPGGFKASVFPAAVAGDNNRAAVFFLATQSPSGNNATGTDGVDTAGNDASTADNFFGTWYPYIAHTCDGGRTWSVVKADSDPLRPGMKNPVQQGVVCKNGTTCPSDANTDTRNLLDFNDVSVDSRGRVVAAYADGCITDACVGRADNSVDRTGNDGLATLTILRQRGGMRLFGAFDPAGPSAPQLSPPVQVQQDFRGTQLQWATPDDNGSPLISYRIYRGGRNEAERLVAEVPANVHNFRDRLARGRFGRGVYYRVTAVNALGESPRNVQFSADSNSKGE